MKNNSKTSQTCKFILAISILIIFRFVEILYPKQTYSKYYTDQAQKNLLQGHEVRAIQNLQKAILHNPNNRLALLKLGLIESSHNDTQSLEYFHRILRLSPDYKNIFSQLLQSDVAKDPIYAHASYEIGLRHFQSKNFAEALKYLERTVLFDNGLTMAHYHLGLTYLKLDNTIKAIEQSNFLDNLQNYSLSEGIRSQIPDISKYDHLLK
jgi:tetratricopeptide (TPR) repeat protein